MVNNLSPLCCSVLAVIFLGEKLTIKQILVLIFTTLGVIVVILGKQSSKNTSHQVSTLLYLALIANPFLTATGSIALRQMKPMNEYVVSVWLNITTGVQSMIIVMLL